MDYSFIKHSMLPGDFHSLFAFSVHKCGSSLMHRMIRQVCERSIIPHLNIPGPLFEKGIGPEWKTDPELLKLILDGYIYFGFRDFPPVFKTGIDFTKTKNVLLVRDPRDALVSQYFSFMPGGSHIIPKDNPERFLVQQKNSAGLSIDEYVLKNAKGIRNKLTAYQQALDFSTTKLFKYEDIFYDKYSFIKDIYSHFNIFVEDHIFLKVAEENHIVPEIEDPSKHIRKGIPGDHRVKLTQKTINSLNQTLGNIAEFYGYKLD